MSSNCLEQNESLRKSYQSTNCQAKNKRSVYQLPLRSRELVDWSLLLSLSIRSRQLVDESPFLASRFTRGNRLISLFFLVSRFARGNWCTSLLFLVLVYKLSRFENVLILTPNTLNLGSGDLEATLCNHVSKSLNLVYNLSRFRKFLILIPIDNKYPPFGVEDLENHLITWPRASFLYIICLGSEILRILPLMTPNTPKWPQSPMFYLSKLY